MNHLWFAEKDIRLGWSEVKRFFWEELEQTHTFAGAEKQIERKKPMVEKESCLVQTEPQLAVVTQPLSHTTSRFGQLHNSA
jgi:hypothetical protein